MNEKLESKELIEEKLKELGVSILVWFCFYSGLQNKCIWKANTIC